ncbi:MAG: hypothetical protein AB1768_06625 [Pseudomonadota bacterium]|jgi:hypothetical protein
MKTWRLALAILLVAAAAFAGGWAYQAYLGPGAVIDLANQKLMCN